MSGREPYNGGSAALAGAWEANGNRVGSQAGNLSGRSYGPQNAYQRGAYQPGPSGAAEVAKGCHSPGAVGCRQLWAGRSGAGRQRGGKRASGRGAGNLTKPNITPGASTSFTATARTTPAGRSLPQNRGGTGATRRTICDVTGRSYPKIRRALWHKQRLEKARGPHTRRATQGQRLGSALRASGRGRRLFAYR